MATLDEMAFPWPAPSGMYDSDGPADAMAVEYQNATYWIAPTREAALHTGRANYRVECLRCGGAAIAESTTSPKQMVKMHARDAHGG